MNTLQHSTEMPIPAIIEELTPYTGRFPKRAVQAAIAQREAITPHLLQALEDVARAPAEFAGRNDYMLHMFATYLLAQFRDKRAFAPLVRILAVPGNAADDLFGDTITESLKRILASVYDGDPLPLQRLAEDDRLNEFVRGAVVKAFLVLAETGQMSREDVLRYYQSLFRGRLKREPNHVWNALASAAADLPAPELVEDLRRACEEGLVEPGYAGSEELKRAALRNPDQHPVWRTKRYALMGDSVSEMQWWAAFHPTKPRPLPKLEPQAVPPHTPQSSSVDADGGPPSLAHRTTAMPVRREPKVGRNDPCPCGSGKKFKKCCLKKT